MARDDRRTVSLTVSVEVWERVEDLALAAGVDPSEFAAQLVEHGSSAIEWRVYNERVEGRA